MFLFLIGFKSKFKLNQEEIYSALYMVTFRLCISWSITSWRKKLFPTNKYLTISKNSSWKLLEVLKHVNLNRVVDEYLRDDKDSWFSTLKENFLFPSLYLLFKNLIYINHGMGQYLFCIYCKENLKCIINVQDIGHCHWIANGADWKKL